MNKEEKENRIHSFALEFLERQQIVPNLYADQIIRGYKEGYSQAEKDTIEKVAKWLKNNLEGVVGGSIYIEDFLKAMKDE